MNAAKRVGILWLLILATFGVFCAVYFPVRAHQWRNDPANFLAHARDLAESGALREAAGVLEAGIEQMRPPGPEPYAEYCAVLTALLANEPDAGDAPAWRARLEAAHPARLFASTHRLMDRDPLARDQAIAQAAAAYLGNNAVPRLSRVAEAALGRMAVDLVAPLGAGRAVLDMTPAEHLALLDIAGGAFRLDGQIGGTGAATPVDMLVQSGGGQGAQRTAHIFIAGRDYARRERGIHAAVISPDTGEVRRWDVFDLFDEPAAADRLLRFLDAAPDGSIGAFAVFDEGSVNMTRELEEALLGFGLRRATVANRELVLIGLRHSFAAIGVKGAPEGTALQAWSPEEFGGYPGLPVSVGVLHRRGELGS